jgi:DNA-binding NarL/FixJ family response regulator
MTGQTPVVPAASAAARTPSDASGAEAAAKQRPSAGMPAGLDGLSALNRRDIEVLRCLANGSSTAQIAASLSVSSNTARTRIRRLRVKLDAADREATVRAAQDLEMLRIPRPRTG